MALINVKHILLKNEFRFLLSVFSSAHSGLLTVRQVFAETIALPTELRPRLMEPARFELATDVVPTAFAPKSLNRIDRLKTRRQKLEKHSPLLYQLSYSGHHWAGGRIRTGDQRLNM